MAFTLYESRYSVTCECCGATQNASDFDGDSATIETTTCETCNAELCEYCESFKCEECKGRFCAIHEHAVHDGEYSLCPGCFPAWLADQEAPCTCVQIDVDYFDASGCEACNPTERKAA